MNHAQARDLDLFSRFEISVVQGSIQVLNISPHQIPAHWLSSAKLMSESFIVITLPDYRATLQRPLLVNKLLEANGWTTRLIESNHPNNTNVKNQLLAALDTLYDRLQTSYTVGLLQPENLHQMATAYQRCQEAIMAALTLKAQVFSSTMGQAANLIASTSNSSFSTKSFVSATTSLASSLSKAGGGASGGINNQGDNSNSWSGGGRGGGGGGNFRGRGGKPRPK
jgi:hypothetical protein